MAKTQTPTDNRKYIDGNFTTVKALGAGQFEGIVATSNHDRQGESLNIVGLDVSAYIKTNPIVIFGHDYWNAESVIGKALSLTKTKDGQLLSRFELFTVENPKAALVSKLIKKGVLALSIGFIPTEIEGDTYTKSEMVEFSVVPVPANAEAAITARALGLTKQEAEIFNKVFKTKDAKVSKTNKETKGAVADELQAEANWDAKRANLRDVCDIWWAFLDVYYNEETPVDNFNTLLKEVVTLYTQVIAGTYVDPDASSDTADGDDEEGDILYTSLEKAIRRGVSDERILELSGLAVETDTSDNTETGDESPVVVETTTENPELQKFLADFSEIVSKLNDLHTNWQKQAGTEAVKKETTSKPEVDTEEAEETTEVAETEAVEEETETKDKSLDIATLNPDNLEQLAEMLTTLSVAVGEKAKEAASLQTTNAETHAIVRKRRVILREAKVQTRKVDKVAELLLTELKKY